VAYADNEGGSSLDNYVERRVTVTPPPDLALTATAPAKAVSAVPHSYTYKVVNQGQGTAVAATLSIHLQGHQTGPSSTVLVTSSSGCTQSPPGVFGDVDLVCPLGDLAPGQSATRQMTVVEGTPGAYTHDANVSSPTLETSYDNNSAYPTVQVTAGAAPVGGLLGQVVLLLATVLNALHL
jgi:hypothetical protein